MKTCPDQILVQILTEKPLPDLYKAGRRLIEIQLKKAKNLLDKIQHNSLSVDNYAYNATIQEGIPLFFAAYNPDFAAHEKPGSIDYPLSNDPMDVVGIEYIYGYLEKLYWENYFCKKFSAAGIRLLLRSYDRNYQNLLLNIFELVLANALGCLLANKRATHLNIEPLDREYLQNSLQGSSPEQLNSILKDAAERLCTELSITNHSLRQYIFKTVRNIAVNLRNSLHVQQLGALFLSFEKTAAPSVIHFEDSPQLDDERFRKHSR